MDLSTFLTNCKNLKCHCVACKNAPGDLVSLLRKEFPKYDFQLVEGAIIVHMVGELKLVMSHAPNQWVARLIVGDKVTQMAQASYCATNAVDYLFDELWDIRNYLTGDLRRITFEHNES